MDPLLIDVPDRIETERLLLRPARPGDGAAVNQAVVASFAELNVWMPWAMAVPTVEQSESFARRAAATFIQRTELPMLVFLKESGEFLGGSGIPRLNWTARVFEVGYWIRTSHWGKGFATEAAGALVSMAFEKLRAHRVEIRCDARNERSWRVAERLGFELEGVLRNDALDNQGRPRSTRVYSRIA